MQISPILFSEIQGSYTFSSQNFKDFPSPDAGGLLARQRRGASERVVLVGERPLAQAVKSFERADPITLPIISPESRFDPGNLIGQLKKRFLTLDTPRADQIGLEYDT